MKETKMFKCSCPIVGINKECHCGAEKHGLLFTSDYWCICICHNRNANLVKKAFLDLANEIEGLADSDQWGGSPGQEGLYEIARMIRDNQFDDIILEYQNE